MLEVAGLYSALHIARLQVNMADPLRLGQAKCIKVRCKPMVVFKDLALGISKRSFCREELKLEEEI